MSHRHYHFLPSCDISHHNNLLYDTMPYTSYHPCHIYICIYLDEGSVLHNSEGVQSVVRKHLWPQPAVGVVLLQDGEKLGPTAGHEGQAGLKGRVNVVLPCQCRRVHVTFNCRIQTKNKYVITVDANVKGGICLRQNKVEAYPL